MGYDREEVEHSLRTRAYDDSFATYLLLGTKASDVSYALLLENNYVISSRVCAISEHE